MKISLFGASGMIGSRILDEALRRGHTVKAIVRNPDKIDARRGVTAIAGDATDATSVARTASGTELAVSAYGAGNEPSDGFSRNAHALLDGLAVANVGRLIIVGGAGTLEVAPGVRLLDAPNFPAAYRSTALAMGAALEIFRASAGSPVVWTFVSPAAMIAPGERTGVFRVGGDTLLVDAKGDSSISAEDFAIAMLDEAEHPTAPNRRMSVAY